ncbi:MAG: ABC transporter ATP-binding protein/permease [Fimbriimonadaceae bacterium]|nr:ABC transporter ATP-binding protein/permease [Alphaproteobacteria bacterium]
MGESIFKNREMSDLEPDSLRQDRMGTKDIVRRIMREHLLPRYKLVALSLASMVVVATTTGAIPFIIQLATDEVFDKHNQTYLIALPIAIIAVSLVKVVAEYISRVTEAYIGHRVVADIRIQMFSKLTSADLGWLQHTHSGRFVSSFLNDANIIRDAAGQTLVAIGKNLLMVLILTATMFWMDWRLSILALIFTPVGLYIMSKQRRRMRDSTEKTMQEIGDLGAIIAQTLSGIRIVKAYRQEKREIARAAKTVNRTVEFVMHGVRAQAQSSPVAEFLTGTGLAAAIFYAGYQGMQGALTTGHFVGFATAAMLTYRPLRSLAALNTTLQQGVSAANRVFSVIDQDVSIREHPDAKPLKVKKGEIRFENVNFAYSDGTPVLKDFSLTLPPGSTVALVGPSGSGKSTALNLLLRFFDPQSGKILIDGQDISKVTVASLREACALVTQEPFLFDDTITENISYGMADVDSAAIEDAAEAAAAHDFISQFPEKYELRVGESGSKLSGGERQRIAFARAMLKNAPILLLDEPTSSLDGEAEAKVQKALAQMVKGRTVLMIAHRLSTVRGADLICVMEEGKIAEIGRHEELLAKNGLYAKFHNAQFLDDHLDRVDKSQNSETKLEIATQSSE